MTKIESDYQQDGASLLKISKVDERILRIELNAPPANTLSEEMMRQLSVALSAAENDKAVKVIILGAKGKLFSAGHDLKEITARRSDSDGGKAYFEKLMKQCSALMQSIVRHPKPIIAEVHGLATAAGCQLVASCDLAVAANDARFCTPGVHIGLFCSTPMVALSRNVSRKHAMEMLLTGEEVAANEALSYGLINQAVAPNYLHQATEALAQKIASKSGRTLKIGKKAFYDQLEMPLNEAYDYASQVMCMNMMDEDANEGIAAFVERRDAKWKDD